MVPIGPAIEFRPFALSEPRYMMLALEILPAFNQSPVNDLNFERLFDNNISS